MTLYVKSKIEVSDDAEIGEFGDKLFEALLASGAKDPFLSSDKQSMTVEFIDDGETNDLLERTLDEIGMGGQYAISSQEVQELD